MRRFLFGIAIATMTIAAPIAATAGDREVADAIVSTLKQKQANGSLKGFDIDLTVEGGKVVFTGKVATQEQLKSVLSAAKATAGVKEVVNNIEVADGSKSAKSKTAVKEASVNPELAVAKGSQKGRVLPASSTEEAPALIEEDTTVSPRDAAITERIISKLSQDKTDGLLRHFELDVSTVDGEVWARGYVANAQQKQHILQAIQRTAGVTKVVDDISVSGQSPVKAASGETVVGSSMPVVGGGSAPRAFAPSSLTAAQCAPGGMSGAAGGPVPMSGGPSYGAGVPRYDQPAMPNYAWPSYAAYPNYAAVTYPKQYSASAWPYIGPFHPYPQVPLGWRKVTLEWDDGLWYLDYSGR